MIPYEITIEWKSNKSKGSKKFFDKSPAFIAGYCQRMIDKGCIVTIEDVIKK